MLCVWLAIIYDVNLFNLIFKGSGPYHSHSRHILTLLVHSSFEINTGTGLIFYLSAPSAFHSKIPKSVVVQSKAFQAATNVHPLSRYATSSLLEIIVPVCPRKLPVKS